MQRLLIVSTSAGAGHNRAAEALRESARVYCPGVRTEWIDSLKYTTRLFARLYEQSYVWLAGYSPALWGVLYKRAGRNKGSEKLKKVVELHDKLAYRKLMDRVEALRPDAAICTHFLPTNVLLAKNVGIPVYVVITDFDVHRLWLHKKAAGYFVASDTVKVQLARYGYPPERIRVMGIPIHPSFGGARARRPSGLPTVLLLGGGFGMGRMEEALGRLLDLALPMRLVAIAGRNEKLRRRLEAVSAGRAEVHGFVDNVHEHMRRADLAVTKAGGLTVSECLASGLPMIVCSPIPGQEEANADHLLDYKVKDLLENAGRLDRMRRAAAAAALPFAGRDILRTVLDESSSRR